MPDNHPKIRWSTHETIALQHWLKPEAVSTMLPAWVWNLVPEWQPAQPLFKAAAIVGCGMSDEVTAGQVSYLQEDARIAAFKVKTRKFAIALHLFGYKCCMTSKASILRTAIMVGMGLPRICNGVMSCTRIDQFTGKEVAELLTQARALCPGEEL